MKTNGLRQERLPPRRWMLMPMEYASRELDGSALLAFLAAERGWGVVLGSKGIRTSTALPVGVLIERWVEPGMAKHFVRSRSQGRVVSAWCEEGLIYPSVEDYHRNKIDERAFGQLFAFFAWGEQQQSDLIKILGSMAERSTVTGNPRFDLYRPEFRDVFRQRVRNLSNEFGSFVLVNTQFPFYNSYYSEEDILSRWWKKGKIRSREEEEKLRHLIQYQRKGFESFEQLVRKLSSRFPDRNIIVRPHPSERVQPWLAISKGLRNVRVVRYGSVAEWILASDICIHTNCTTGVEAYLLGRPSISYRFVRDDRFDLFLPNSLSVQVFDLNTLVSIVAAALQGKTIVDAGTADLRRDTALRYIANAEGPPACDRILDVLDTVELPVAELVVPDPAVSNFNTTLQRGLSLARAALKGSEKLNRKQHIVQRLDGLTERSLQSLLSSAQEVTGRFGGVSIRRLEADRFCIY